MFIKKHPSQNELNELFEYRDGMLFRKKSVQAKHGKIGDRVGFQHSIKYRYVCINRVPYLEHRIIWIMLNGEIPSDMEIDHIEGRANNIENLRIASKSQNCHNRTKYKCNKTGFKGVGKRGNKYHANIRVNGLLKHLGDFDTPEQAYEEYKKAAMIYHNEFANF